MKPTQEQDAAIQKFVDIITNFERKCNEADNSSLPPAYFSIEYGQKFARIVRHSYGGNRSAHCFVHILSGDIYKSASWAAPAKHVRGNINDDMSGLNAMSRYGARYL